MKKPLKLLHVFWVLPLAVVVCYLVWLYIHRELNDATSAKPQANELAKFIKTSKGSVLHTYNRTTSTTVSSPSYEYYIEYSDTNIENRSKELSAYLTDLGYNAKYKKYTALDYICTKYGYGRTNLFPSGQFIESDADASAYCNEKIGIEDPRFYGGTDNDNQPYYTLYGENGDRTVYAEVSDKTFNITSNDSWRDSYAKKFNVEDGRVRPGHSMVTVKFGRN